MPTATTKTKKPTKQQEIRKLALDIYNGAMVEFPNALEKMKPDEINNHKLVRERIYRRARMAVDAAEIFFANWDSVKGKFIEEDKNND